MARENFKELAVLKQVAVALQMRKVKRLEELERRRLAREAMIQDSASKTADTAITELVLACVQQ